MKRLKEGGGEEKMKKLILILVLMFCLIFSINTLAFEKVDVSGVGFSSTAVYYAKIQTFLDHGLGTDSSKVIVTADDPALSVYGTSSAVSGTIRGGVVSLTITASGAAITEGLFVTVDSEYSTGSWCNAVVGRINYGTTGSASGGMAASFCGEMNIPAQVSPGGSYYPYHSYLNVPTDAELIDSTAFNYAFERYELAGGAKGEFDDYGDFWHIIGLIPEVDHVLSEHYLTLRTLVQPTSTAYDKFLVLSHEQDMLSLGTDGNPVSIVAGLDKLAVYTTSESTTGTIITAIIKQTMTVGGAALYEEALRVQLIGDVNMGASHNAIFAQIDYVEDGYAHGEGAVITAELSMASVTAVPRGEYTFYKMELDLPTACDLQSNPIALFKLNIWGGAETEFDDHGYLFDFEGVTSGANDFFYLSDITVTKADGTLKIRILDVDYYIWFTTVQTGGD
jgi:hypothetical protein